MGIARPEFKNVNFTFGSAVGAGIQSLFATGGDLDKALLAALLEWDMELLYGVEIDPESKKKNDPKSFPFVLDALKKFYPHYLVIAPDWEVYTYEVNGVTKPAIELSARVELLNGFVYRIYIDVVLRNRKTGMLVVMEIKTDGYKYVQSEKYGNSNQALSYSTILDRIAPDTTSFDVWYFVFYTSLEKWEFFSFNKSRLQKANWIRTILYDTKNIKECLDSEFFPKQGESCVEYGRPCEYYGACDMSNASMYGGPHTIAKRLADEKKTPYDFEYSLQEIIDKQIAEVKK